jgi:murein DD-endopeptidase MepM/ murein hydrolase activator NlpD
VENIKRNFLNTIDADCNFPNNRSILLIGFVLILFQWSFPLVSLAFQADLETTHETSEIRTIMASNPQLKSLKLDNYQIAKAVVKNGQTLSTLLHSYGVPASKILQLSNNAKGILDLRTIRAGNSYWIIRDAKPPFSIIVLIYQTSFVDFVVFELGNSIDVFACRKTLYKKTRFASGSISSSLWNALKAQNVDTVIIPKLQEVFGYKANFRKLMPNDRFMVFYEEYSDGSQIVQIGSIIAAKLTSGEDQLSAYRYSHCDTFGYYDENGNNMQSAFLYSPIQGSTVTSGYSDKRKHPITKEYRRHPGIDYAAPTGTPVMSVGDGTVIDIGYTQTAGNYIKIRHNLSFGSHYLHLNTINSGLQNGSRVNRGDVIGFVGSTGLTTGPHLDFRFSKNGRLLEYSTVTLPDGKQLDMKCKADFDIKVQQIALKSNANSPKAGKT